MNEEINQPPMAPQVPQVPKVEPKFHCSNCREDYKEEGIRQQPLDYIQDPVTGKPVAAKTRVSIFCKKCDHFIGIADPERDRTLEGFKKKPAAPPSA